jgi:O-antigen/teichoic acid export membrane protein
MAENITTAARLLDIPAVQRERIVSGMRWTVWLSVLAIPFSYGTAIILARTSPEAVGTFGLLGVYIGLSLGLFYLGGDAVAIKFIPELAPEKRLSFLVSYFLIICLAVVPWILIAAIWPRSLHHVLGSEASQSFELFLIILSPLTMLASLVSAALKGLLEIGWAQVIWRLSTIASFFVYAILFFLSRATLAHSFPLIIWGTYLVLCVAGAAAGFWRLWQFCGWRNYWRSLKFFVPRGFWSYTLSLQQGSALNFFTGRLDVILILNFGGLAVLGKYVAVITLAAAIRLISTYFIGTLLPSLTNTLAEGNKAGAAAAFHTHMRIIFFVSATSTYGLVLFASPIAALLGPQYAGLSSTIMLTALLIGVSTPGGMGGTLLSSVGKQQRAVYISLGQITLYLIMFALLWPTYGLIGAVLAYGISWVLGSAALLLIAMLSSPFEFSATRDYCVFGGVAVASAFVEHWMMPGLGKGLALWLGAVGLFLALGRYDVEECKTLLHCIIPLSRLCPTSV